MEISKESAVKAFVEGLVKNKKRLWMAKKRRWNEAFIASCEINEALWDVAEAAGLGAYVYEAIKGAGETEIEKENVTNEN